MWYISTISFTLIIHVVTYKVFVESVFWNKISITVGIISILFYYVSILSLNSQSLALVFQPQILALVNKVIGNLKVWCVILFVPFIAILPDVTSKIVSRMFYPTVIDKLM